MPRPSRALSRTTLDGRYGLPRFNMPLELGIFLGARRYGGRSQSRKVCLILDRDPYRYQVFCSDLAGQDIRAHHNDVGVAIAIVRDWIRTMHPHAVVVPGVHIIRQRYFRFQKQLPRICRVARLDARNLTFVDYRTLVTGWLSENPV